jgi:hypothetical protein
VDALPASFAGTRLAVHALAEHVLCGLRYAAVGRVGLTPLADGVATPPFDDRVVGVRGVELVDATVEGGERRAPASTLRAAAAFFDGPLGPPPLWTPATAPDVDAPLGLDAAGVAALAAWFGLVRQVLTTMYPDAPPTLWPEHFDLAVTVDDVTVGGSPGDDAHSEPYLYVLPPGKPAPDGDLAFWNEPFGASLGYDRIGDPADAIAFLAEAHRHLGSS